MRKLTLSLIFVATVLAIPARAQDFRPVLEGYLETAILTWANDPDLIEAVKAQNLITASYDQARIDALDQTWRAEIGTVATPLIDTVLTGPTADFLRARVTESGGRITEAFVMDAQGLNVAASAITSDYWQGDEDKHALTHVRGPGAVHISEVGLDESTQTYQAQISITLTDPVTGDALGALTVGVNAELLM